MSDPLISHADAILRSLRPAHAWLRLHKVARFQQVNTKAAQTSMTALSSLMGGSCY